MVVSGMFNHTNPPTLGTPVIFIDDQRHPHAAITAQVLEAINPDTDLPHLNLTVLHHTGHPYANRNIPPAYHDGSRHRIIQRYIHPDSLLELLQQGEVIPAPEKAVQSLGSL